MPASPAFASNSQPGKTLVCGVNWLGDSLMSWPALDQWRATHPQATLSLLVKPSVAPLWPLWSASSPPLILQQSGWRGAWRTAAALRREKFDTCYILPHSFRSAWIPFLAGIPRRIGTPGHFRSALLTHVIQVETTPTRYHQAYEYADVLLGPGAPLNKLEPRLCIPPAMRDWARAQLSEQRTPRIALLPGAARGPSKRWPPERFAEAGRRLQEACGGSILVFGGPSETALCADVARMAGPPARSFAGHTTLAELGALLQECAVALTNDSGGMHMAAAAGVPLVAIFGITDPAKTGPLGARQALLQNSPIACRDVARHSARAEQALAAITVEQAVEAARPFIKEAPP